MNLKEKIDNLPKTPGIYMMKDKIKELKQQAEQNRIAAQEEFEKELFE